MKHKTDLAFIFLKQVEACKPLNDASKARAWSKYSKESSAYQKKNPDDEKVKAVKAAKAAASAKTKLDAKERKRALKEKKLEELIGPLKDDEGFKEFLAANKAIKSRDSIWMNDINLDIGGSADGAGKEEEDIKKKTNVETKADKSETVENGNKSSKKKKKGKDDPDVKVESGKGEKG